MSHPVLPLLPGAARSVGPSVGLVEGPDGGMVLVFGLVTHAWAAGDATPGPTSPDSKNCASGSSPSATTCPRTWAMS